MSICPDKIVISEYVDGQLPSPWKEKLEQHIAECPKCNAELEKYKKLGAILKQPGIEETRDFDYDLSFKKLDAKLHDVKKHGSRTEEVKTHFWHKTIRLPAPMLVAAVLVVLFLPPFTFFAAMSQKQQTQSIAYPLFQASSGVVRATNASQKQLDFNSGVSGFLRFYMPTQKNGNFIVIDMPANTVQFGQNSAIFQQAPQVETIKKKEPTE